jgi:hypothetical protein
MIASGAATDMTQKPPLQKEMETYTSKLPELVSNIGKFALIKGDSMEGIYDTYGDALKIGYDRFKLEPFMVKQIMPAEQIQFFTRDIDRECPAST